MNVRLFRVGIACLLVLGIPFFFHVVPREKKSEILDIVEGGVTRETIATDSDGDGLRDWEERMQGTDPFVSTEREKTPTQGKVEESNPPVPPSYVKEDEKQVVVQKTKPTITTITPLRGGSGTTITIMGEGFGSRALVYTGFGIERVSSVDGKTLSYTLKGPSAQNIKPGDLLPDGSKATSSDIVPVPEKRSYPLWVYVQTEGGFAGPVIFTYEEIIGS